MAISERISDFFWISFIAAISVVFAAGCGPTGPVRYPISGQVIVDGAPAERVLVQLIRQQEGADTASGNDVYPSGYTDANGQFTIRKDQSSPGAIEGKYRVVFSWLSSGELDAFDKLQGRYSDVNKSKETIVVPSDGLVKLKFELSSGGRNK